MVSQTICDWISSKSDSGTQKILNASYDQNAGQSPLTHLSS